jgi:hypothetical protein
MSKYVHFELGKFEHNDETSSLITTSITKIFRRVNIFKKFHYKLKNVSKKRANYGIFNIIRCITAHYNYFTKLAKNNNNICANSINAFIKLLSYTMIFIYDIQIYIPYLNIDLYSYSISLINALQFVDCPKKNILMNKICKFQNAVKKIWMQNFNLFIRLPSIFIENMITTQDDIFYIFKKYKNCKIWLHPKLIMHLNNLYKAEIFCIFKKIPDVIISEILSFLYIYEYAFMNLPKYSSSLISNITVRYKDKKPLHICNFEIMI